jgi:VCBS repeat-containing protein
VQFTAGQQSRTFTVAIKGDIAAEGNETFVVKLLSASGAIIGDGEATATISNDDQNKAPVAGDDAFSTPFNTVLETNPAALLANDVDVDGGPLTLTAVGGAVNGQVTLQDGKILFTPDAGFSGPASFTYTVTDALGATDTATVAVTVAAAPPPPNRAPVANADAYQVNEDVQLTVLAGNGLLVNDTDPDGNPLIAELVNGPSNGTLTVNPDGSFVYKAAANYHGVDSFTYRARDAALGSYPVTVTITVNPVNDAPAATADSYGVAEDGTLTVNAANGVLANDTDVEGNPLTAVLATGPANGTVTLNPNGSFSYVPNANFAGTDSFTYRANDGQANSQPVTVTIHVSPVNDAPVAVANSYAVNEDTALQVGFLNGVLANDTDVDGPALSASLVTGPVNGTLKAYIGGNNAANDLSAVSADQDGTNINAAGGNDTLRDGKFDDLLTGGAGDDVMSGGGGADQFRFFGTQIEGASDLDRIFDLNFGQGDSLVFNNFGANTFLKANGVNAFNGGTSAILDSFGDIVAAAGASNLVTAKRASQSNDNLLLSISDADGQIQTISITGGWSQYVLAGGTEGL